MKKLWKQSKEGIVSFWRNEQGIGTLEIVLIIAVVVIIFLLFKDFIVEFVEKLVSGSENELKESFKNERNGAFN
ncbi:Flp1 family type IVb pilin [Paenibacillus septentrionalis]|uniref:Flp1 family type IVb pilin n=1 Tax=Paenibacillus septentrionalis TaxID=429342 RepID=A0ABW1V1Z3_9BACL